MCLYAPCIISIELKILSMVNLSRLRPPCPKSARFTLSQTVRCQSGRSLSWRHWMIGSSTSLPHWQKLIRFVMFLFKDTAVVNTSVETWRLTAELRWWCPATEPTVTFKTRIWTVHSKSNGYKRKELRDSLTLLTLLTKGPTNLATQKFSYRGYKDMFVRISSLHRRHWRLLKTFETTLS